MSPYTNPWEKTVKQTSDLATTPTTLGNSRSSQCTKLVLHTGIDLRFKKMAEPTFTSYFSCVMYKLILFYAKKSMVGHARICLPPIHGLPDQRFHHRSCSKNHRVNRSHPVRWMLRPKRVISEPTRKSSGPRYAKPSSLMTFCRFKKGPCASPEFSTFGSCILIVPSSMWNMMETCRYRAFSSGRSVTVSWKNP